MDQCCFRYIFFFGSFVGLLGRFLVSHLHHLNKMQFIWYGIKLAAVGHCDKLLIIYSTGYFINARKREKNTSISEN